MVFKKGQKSWNSGLTIADDRVRRNLEKTCLKQNIKLWSNEELEVLKNIYPQIDIPIEEVFKTLPNRTPKVIYNKAEQLGLSRGGRWKKGRKPWNSGKHLPQETKDKISETLSGSGCYWYGKSIPNNIKKKISNSNKKRWQDEEYVRKIIKSRLNLPNKAELKLDKIIQETIPNEYKYVGNGEFILGGKCPDFLNVNGKKLLIELYGDYWHFGEDENERIDYFKEFGFDTLIIWEKELKDIETLKDKLMEYNKK